MPLRYLRTFHEEEPKKKAPPETVGYKKPTVPITREDVRRQNELLSGGYGLDRFVPSKPEPEKPKEPAPLTHLKVGDIVHNEIGDWRELGDYGKVIDVKGDQVTVEGVEPDKAGHRKTFDERHFLTFSMGWGDHPGGKQKYPGEYYFFHFKTKPPPDVLAFGLRQYEEATGSEEYTKYYNLFNYYAPEAEFKDELKRKNFGEKLLEHHYWSPHGLTIDEVFHGVKPLPRKAWEMDTRISPGRFRRGEWVYTCRCGREGEKEWMTEHLAQAHGVRGAANLEREFRAMPKRREYANIRAGELKDLTPEAKELLKTRTGYRCETAYGEGYRNAFDVLEHEVLELGNDDMVNEAEEALGLPRTKDLGGDLAPPLHAINEAIEKKFGKDAKVLWLATRSGVKWYCEGEEPDKYEIPKDALVISDLGDEGQLFLMSGKDARKVGAA